MLEEAGWRFFDSNGDRANISLENNVKITDTILDEYGEDFEKTKNGFIDFLLLDHKGFPFIVLEAKAEDKNPLFAKEQARKYAVSQNCLLSYFQTEHPLLLGPGKRKPECYNPVPRTGNGKRISSFKPDRKAWAGKKWSRLYRPLHNPNYKNEPGWQNPSTREQYNSVNKLRFLRTYQVAAIESIQQAVSKGRTVSCSKWPPNRENTGVGAVIKCSCERSTPGGCCSLSTGWNWKTRHTRHSFLTLKMIIRR